MRRFFRRLRRAAPTITFILALIVGGISVWQAWGIIEHLRQEERETSRIFGAVIGALNDSISGGRDAVLLQLSRDITESGIPLIVTDEAGAVSACANIALEPDPCAAGDLTDPRIPRQIQALDQVNQPIRSPKGSIHYGATDVGRRLTWLTVFQLLALAVAVAAGTWGYRAAIDRDRDRLWVAMARESAHQLGTPLMSAAAWIERLRDTDPDTKQIAKFLQADVDRLDRVAQRFERIGRPARAEKVGVGSLVARVAQYFEPRLPRHANKVTISVDAPSAGPMVSGDPVLLEWAVEALVRNSIDALSGRGGKITVGVKRNGNSVSISVADDGPGIGIEVRGNLFEPGISTKSGGWGIGLALAHRIVEDVHGGQLRMDPVETGAMFIADLPVAILNDDTLA